MKIAIIGADGQLGSDLVKTLSEEELFPLFFPEFDITQPEKIQSILTEIGADVVINTAAFHRVDECEDNPHQSFLVNAIAVRDLALICRALGSILVHFSTDYVFDGRKGTPYTEDDAPNPLSVYGVSKLAGEYFVREILERYFLVRSCGLYGTAGSREKGTNFVETMLSLAKSKSPVRVVSDQWVSPTSTHELSSCLAELIRTDRFGLFHLTNEGECTWCEFARTIFDLIGEMPELVSVNSEKYGARARRPSYSVLENKRAGEIGLRPLSHWKDALKAYLIQKGFSLTGSRRPDKS